MSSASQPDTAAVPVDDGCQVQKPMLYGDVCNVDGPRLAGAFDIRVFEQIRENLSLLLPFGKIHLWVDNIDAHFTHKPHGSEAAGFEFLQPQLL